MKERDNELRNAEVADKIMEAFRGCAIQYLENGCVSVFLKTKDGTQKVELTVDSNYDILKIQHLQPTSFKFNFKYEPDQSDKWQTANTSDTINTQQLETVKSKDLDKVLGRKK